MHECHCIIFLVYVIYMYLVKHLANLNYQEQMQMYILISSVNELLKMKEELTKERDEQLNDIVKLRESLAQATSQQQKLESDKKECEEKIQEVNIVHIINLLR